MASRPRSITVSPETASRCGEPGALEVVRRGGIDPVVLAEQEATEERLLRAVACRGRAPPPLGP